MSVCNCRFCGSAELSSLIDLGRQPLANAFTQSVEASKGLRKYDLEVLRCLNCNLCQLSTVVHWSEIYADYYYHSSTSKPLVKQYEMLVESLVLTADLQPEDLILDIGCNDGIMLDAYERFLKKDQRIGVDPSSACLLAKEKDYKAYQSPINVNLAIKICSDVQGKFKIITATNVFAHIDNIHEVVESIKVLLDEDGIFVIEAPYLFDMLQGGYFDVIYHEHYSYLSLMPLKMLFQNYGLSVFNVEKSDVAASGPSVRYFISWDGKKAINKNVELMLQEEKSLIDKNIFDSFCKNVKSWKQELLKIIRNEIKNGGKIGFIGAPAKGNTLLNYLFEDSAEGVQYIAEVNEKKIGRYSPGIGLEVIKEENFNRIPFSLAILLTWNYPKYFIDKFEQEKPGYKLVVPLPEITIYE
jgi:SAM-dependent methyltransferase